MQRQGFSVCVSVIVSLCFLLMLPCHRKCVLLTCVSLASCACIVDLCFPVMTLLLHLDVDVTDASVGLVWFIYGSFHRIETSVPVDSHIAHKVNLSSVYEQIVKARFLIYA